MDFSIETSGPRSKPPECNAERLVANVKTCSFLARHRKTHRTLTGDEVRV